MPRKVHTEKNEVATPLVEEVGTDVTDEPESIPSSIAKDTTRARKPRKTGKKSMQSPKEIAQAKSERKFVTFVIAAQERVDETMRSIAPELILDGWKATLSIETIPSFGDPVVAVVKLEQFAEESELDEAGSTGIWIMQTISTFQLDEDLEAVVIGLIASVKMIYGEDDE